MSRRTDSRRRPAVQGAGREVDLGPFALAFAAVLVVGLVGLGGWWVSARRTGTGTAGAPATVPASRTAPTASGVVVDPSADGWTTPDGDVAAGDPSAPITLVEYADFQCPNCRAFAVDVLPWLRRTWMAGGMVKLVHRDFAIRGDASVAAAEAAHCAGDQGRYWAYHDALFARPSAEASARDELVALASSIGLDGAALGACLDAGRHRARVARTTADGHAQGLAGTPTYFVDGRKTEGAIAMADWDALFRIYAAELAWPTPPVGP